MAKQELEDGLAHARRVATTPEMQVGIDKLLAVTVVDKTHPAFSTMLVERDGTVWIRGYEPRVPTTGAPPLGGSWARFDPSGKLLGTLRIPEGSDVIRFTRGHAILSKRDADTETVHVSVHRIEAVH